MGGAILTKREQAFKKALQNKLEKDLKNLTKIKKQEKLDIQNEAIRKFNKLNIEYKYKKATKSMIHDGEKYQAMSMLGALKFIGILKA